MAELNLFQILGPDFTNALTKEERQQIDAISTRLSKDTNLGEQLEKHNDFIKSRIDMLKKEAEESRNYSKELESGFM